MCEGLLISAREWIAVISLHLIFAMRSLAAGRNLYKIAHQKIVIGTKCKLKRRVDFRVGVGLHGEEIARVPKASGGDRKSKVLAWNI